MLLFLFFLLLPLQPSLTQSVLFSLSADFTEGLPHRSVTGQDPAHPGRNPRQVCTFAVKPPLQDPPPVAHVPVRCHAAGRSQLAVPQHHCGTGAGHWRHAGTVNPHGGYRLKKTSLPSLEVWLSSHQRNLKHLFLTLPSLLWPSQDHGHI